MVAMRREQGVSNLGWRTQLRLNSFLGVGVGLQGLQVDIGFEVFFVDASSSESWYGLIVDTLQVCSSYMDS